MPILNVEHDMSNNVKPGFYVGQTEDGAFVAASVATPAFFFYGESEEAVIAKAKRAFAFFLSNDGQHFSLPKSQTKEVLNFVPQRRIEACLETA
jgi:predicted RNase H-like HicB family nuclease